MKNISLLLLSLKMVFLGCFSFMGPLSAQALNPSPCHQTEAAPNEDCEACLQSFEVWESETSLELAETWFPSFILPIFVTLEFQQELPLYTTPPPKYDFNKSPPPNQFLQDFKTVRLII